LSRRDDEKARRLLRRMSDMAIASADPAGILAAHLPEPPRGRCIVIEAVKGGKLAAAGAPARVVTLAISDIPTSSARSWCCPEAATADAADRRRPQLPGELPFQHARRLT